METLPEHATIAYDLCMSSPLDPLTRPRHSVKKNLHQAIYLPLGIAALATLLLVYGITNLMTTTTWVTRMDALLSKINHVGTNFVNMETGLRGYLLTHEEMFLEPYDRALAVVASDLAELEDQVIELGHRELAAQLVAHGQAWLEYAHACLAQHAAGDPLAINTTTVGKGKRMMDNLRQDIATLATVGETLRDQRQRETHTATTTIITLAAILGLVGGAFLALVTYRHVRQVATEYEKACEEQLQDGLTNLFNRKGFLTLAKQQARLAVRSKLTPVLYYFDLDGLKTINDTHGHHAGSQAIVDFANILLTTFRAADVTARLSGDEFAVLACHPDGEGVDIVLARLASNLEIHNTKVSRPYKLSVSQGNVVYDVTQTIDAALMEADVQMYEAKRRKQDAALAKLLG